MEEITEDVIDVLGCMNVRALWQIDYVKKLLVQCKSEYRNTDSQNDSLQQLVVRMLLRLDQNGGELSSLQQLKRQIGQGANSRTVEQINVEQAQLKDLVRQLFQYGSLIKSKTTQPQQFFQNVVAAYAYLMDADIFSAFLQSADLNLLTAAKTVQAQTDELQN